MCFISVLRKILSLFFIFIIFSSSCFSQSLNLDMQDVPVSQALRTLAKFLNINIVISPFINGSVSLHLNSAPAAEAFNLLLSSQQLTKIQKANIWYIIPQSELVKHKQEEFKLQQILNDTTPLVTEVWQIHYAKAEDIVHLLQENNNSLLSKRGQVHIDTRTNTLCIQDLPENLSSMHALIQKLDIPVQQILIEARLASVDSDYERMLGVDFSVQDKIGGGDAVNYSQTARQGNHFSLAVARLADGSLLDLNLNALEKAGKGELISSPSLFTANQKTATIEAGEEIPYQEVSRSGATGVAFKKAVLSLKVTPQIMPGNKVLLQLQVNQDKPSNRMVLGVPAINTRQIITNILINNGQTLVLGGIYERNKEHDEQGIPFLSKIPLVGLLFQQQNEIEHKRELLVFVTPKIIT